MKFNPYKILGVKPDADLETIKAAYKEKAKQHHPDAGGESEEFRKIKQAYDLLLNAEHRRLYDLYGALPGDAASELHLKAVMEIVKIFGQLLEQQSIVNLEHVDIVKDIRMVVENARHQAQKKINHSNDRLKYFKEALSVYENRLKNRHKKKPNIFTQALQFNITALENTVKAMERELELPEEMLKVLSDYSFEFDGGYNRMILIGNPSTSGTW